MVALNSPNVEVYSNCNCNMRMDFSVIVSIFIFLAVFVIILIIISRVFGLRIESPERRAGRLGERFASSLISETLEEGDVLLTNVRIFADGKQTELDNVIINCYGIFIIEVKNYYGEIFGDEDEHEWVKNTITPAGNIYQKSVKNPIKQVKRQIYILSSLLKENGLNVWIEGYVFFVERNCPVDSDFVLETTDDIYNAIHTASRNRLSVDTRSKIISLLS